VPDDLDTKPIATSIISTYCTRMQAAVGREHVPPVARPCGGARSHPEGEGQYRGASLGSALGATPSKSGLPHHDDARGQVRET